MKQISRFCLSLLLVSSLLWLNVNALAGDQLKVAALDRSQPQARDCVALLVNGSKVEAFSAALQEAATAHELETVSGWAVDLVNLLGQAGAVSLAATNPAFAGIAALQGQAMMEVAGQLELGQKIVGGAERALHGLRALMAHLRKFEIYRLPTRTGGSVDVLVTRTDGMTGQKVADRLESWSEAAPAEVIRESELNPLPFRKRLACIGKACAIAATAGLAAVYLPLLQGYELAQLGVGLFGGAIALRTLKKGSRVEKKDSQELAERFLEQITSGQEKEDVFILSTQTFPQTYSEAVRDYPNAVRIKQRDFLAELAASEIAQNRGLSPEETASLASAVGSAFAALPSSVWEGAQSAGQKVLEGASSMGGRLGRMLPSRKIFSRKPKALKEGENPSE